MATVKLEISEYELMKKHAAMLEDSNKEILRLSEENKKLQQYNIDVLKANEKNVTIETRTMTSKMIRAKCSSDDIRSSLRRKMENIIHRVTDDIRRQAANNPQFGTNGYDRMMGNDMYGRPHNPMDVRVPKEIAQIIHHYMHEYDFNPEQLHDLFYHEQEITVGEPCIEITHKGLDQVKADLKAKVLKSLTAESQEALRENPRIEKESRKNKRDFDNITRELEGMKDLNDSKAVIIDNLKKKEQDMIQASLDNFDDLEAIDLCMSEELGIFDKKKRLSNIQQILDKRDGRNTK